MIDQKQKFDRILKEIGEEAAELQARTQRVVDLMGKPLQTEIGATPYEVIYEEDRIRLKHYKPKGERRIKTPLLVVYALINRETMLDLQPGRSVVQSFLNAGIDLYMIDWGYPTRKDRFQTIEDHVCGYMDNVVDFVRRHSGSDRVNLMGICMGGTFSVMYSALYPEKVRNLITTVAPTNFDTDKGLLHLWVRGLNADHIVNAFGNAPGDMMNFGFLLLNPARLIVDKYVGFLDNADKKEFLENFFRMEKWIFDSPDVPGETFREFIVKCYQQNLLIRNRLELGGRRVDLKNVTMPVLNIYGRFDHLVPPEAAGGLLSHVGSRDTEDVCMETGHIGIFVSGKTQKELVPKIVEFIGKRDVSPEGNGRRKPAAGARKKAARPAQESGMSGGGNP
jgi:polyhydroxyalkanoate synthase